MTKTESRNDVAARLPECMRKCAAEEDVPSLNNTIVQHSFDPRVPNVGEAVRWGSAGEGVVLAHFVEHGWLGIWVGFAKPPAWANDEQRGNYRTDEHEYVAGLFGAEVEVIR